MITAPFPSFVKEGRTAAAAAVGVVRSSIPNHPRCAVRRSVPSSAEEGSLFSWESLASMVKRAPARRRPRKAKAGTKGLTPEECRLEKPAGAAAEVSEAIEKAGGCVVGSYKDPLGGHPTLFAILPIETVEPTPFQRDLSDAHHKRLADVINKTGRFLDPVIAVLAPKGIFWTPNGRHRLAAMRRLGAKSIAALVVADT